MNRIHSIVFAGFTALLTAPTLAQTPPASQPGAAANVSQQPSGANATVPAGSLQKVQNDWRGRSLIGAAVYNDNGQRVATINDLLITDDGRVERAILSVGAVRRKLVAVPYNQLRFAPSRSTVPTGVVAGDGGVVPSLPPSSDTKAYGAVLPGATRDSLAKMEPFHFAP